MRFWVSGTTTYTPAVSQSLQRGLLIEGIIGIVFCSTALFGIIGTYLFVACCLLIGAASWRLYATGRLKTTVTEAVRRPLSPASAGVAGTADQLHMKAQAAVREAVGKAREAIDGGDALEQVTAQEAAARRRALADAEAKRREKMLLAFRKRCRSMMWVFSVCIGFCIMGCSLAILPWEEIGRSVRGLGAVCGIVGYALTLKLRSVLSKLEPSPLHDGQPGDTTDGGVVEGQDATVQGSVGGVGSEGLEGVRVVQADGWGGIGLSLGPQTYDLPLGGPGGNQAMAERVVGTGGQHGPYSDGSGNRAPATDTGRWVDAVYGPMPVLDPGAPVPSSTALP